MGLRITAEFSALHAHTLAYGRGVAFRSAYGARAAPKTLGESAIAG